MPLVASDFTWDFLFDSSSAWPMTHILNPFMIEILGQKTWLTFLMFYFWESLEVLAVTVFSGQYVIFTGDDSEIEIITDTLMGDPFQGILGVILARLTIKAWGIPAWAPNPIGIYGALFFKRVLQYIFWVVPVSFANMRIDITGAYSINVGVFIVLVSTVFFWWTWINSNDNTETERVLFWSGYDRKMYIEAHTGIIINAILLIMSASIHIGYSYFMTWIFWSIAMLLNIYVLILKSNTSELYKFINFYEYDRLKKAW